MVTQRYLPHFFRSYFSAKSLEPPPGFRTTADRQDHVEHTQHKHKHVEHREAQAQAQAGTVTPVSSQRRCTAATQLLGGLSCLICGKMLAALAKNLQKLSREKILDEKAAGAVCSPTWCTRFSAKCGHPLFTVISAACIVERPLFCRAMFVQPTFSRAWSPRNMFFSKLRKIHILQGGQIYILHHLHAYVAICRFFFGCKDKCVF